MRCEAAAAPATVYGERVGQVRYVPQPLRAEQSLWEGGQCLMTREPGDLPSKMITDGT